MRLSSSPSGASFGPPPPASTAFTRRWFLRGAAFAGGAAAAGAVVAPRTAAAAAGTLHGTHPSSPSTNRSPKPIPWGATGEQIGDPGNTHFFHVLPPFPPGPDGQYTECSTITD